MSQYSKKSPHDQVILNSQQSNEYLCDRDGSPVNNNQKLLQIQEISPQLLATKQARLEEPLAQIQRKGSVTEVPAMEASMHNNQTIQVGEIEQQQQKKENIKIKQQQQQQLDNFSDCDKDNKSDLNNMDFGDMEDHNNHHSKHNYSNILNVSRSHQHYSMDGESFYKDDSLKMPYENIIQYEYFNLFLNLMVIVFAVLGFGMTFLDSSMQILLQVVFAVFYVGYLAECFLKSQCHQYIKNTISQKQFTEYLQVVRKARPEIIVETSGQEVTQEGARNTVYHEKKTLEMRKVADLTNIVEIVNFQQENKLFRINTTFDCNIADKSLKVLQQQMSREADKKGSQLIQDKIIYNLEGKVPYQICSSDGVVPGVYRGWVYALVSVVGFSWVYRIVFQKNIPMFVLHIQKVINSSL